MQFEVETREIKHKQTDNSQDSSLPVEELRGCKNNFLLLPNEHFNL